MVAVMGMYSQARGSPLPVHDVGHDVTEATITVDASPSQVYALVTDYARWPALLSDVRSVTVERGPRDHARVRFSSKILAHEVTVQFDNVPDRLIRFVGVEGPPGGRARGTYVLEPVDGGRRTRVTASLYLEVVGAPSLFVRDAKVRTMREAKLRADLTDVLHRTATSGSAAG
jgi:ribosome-associated toxin RatA of RatAB toxin-antitoxin module